MPTLIPPFIGDEVKSAAEQKMYTVLNKLDMKDTYVLHSLGLPKHLNKIYGEIDFVVACPMGVACLEIKGGRVECRNGEWFFIDRYGIERKKPEGPFAQVVGNMFSLKEVLKNRFKDDKRVRNVLMACGVVFPDIKFTSSDQEIISEIVYDRTSVSITEYIKQIFSYWASRNHIKETKLCSADVKNIVQFLRGEFTFIPSLVDGLGAVEKKLVRLTAEQTQVMDALSINDHLVIEGKAGTGKTLLAMNFALKRVEQGEKVLYLTFNKNLANNIAGLLDRFDNLMVINIHALFGEYVPIDQEKMNEDASRYFSEILPSAFYGFISDMNPEKLDKLKYDLLIMDEGQDILKPNYISSLDCLLKGGMEHGHWAVFLDEEQNIYNTEFQQGIRVLEMFNITRFKLYVNCRNTAQIGAFCTKLSGIELGNSLYENGEEVRKVSYKSDDELAASVQKVLFGLEDERVDMRDVVILAPKKYKNTKLASAGIEVEEIRDGMNINSYLPRFSTIQGYKGLDSKVVILCELEKIHVESFARFTYIATTRARTLLYVVGSEEFWKAHDNL